MFPGRWSVRVRLAADRFEGSNNASLLVAGNRARLGLVSVGGSGLIKI